jgi:rhodanese-related sulfurtransferase
MFGNLFGNLLSLRALETYIETSTRLPHIEAYMLFQQLNGNERMSILLFDTREQDEYDVSHLAGAIRLDPEIPAGEFSKSFQDMLRGKTVIFYCSVGQRSASLLGRLQDLCRDAGVTAMYNLKGGIFRWYNDGHPVVSNEGETNAIHPCNAFWGMLLSKRDSAK